MHIPQVNYLAVLTAGIVIFLLGGLWYSPLLFARKWTALSGKTEAELKEGSADATPTLYLLAFVCGLISAWALAVILNHFVNLTILRAMFVGALCWFGFAGATSFTTALFSMKPKQLWAIDSMYNLVSFMIAAIILATWR